MTDNPFSPITDARTTSAPIEKSLWALVSPVPPDAIDAPERHYQLGKPSQRWSYLNADGELIGYVCRYNEKDGGKSFRPLHLFSKNGQLDWRYGAVPEPRPLYGLDRLAKNTSATVIITEGEKSADAVAKLLPDYVCMTSPAGSKSASKADWSPVAGRDVVIWPDNDEPGQKYAEDVASLLIRTGARSVSVLTVPDAVSIGWDAGDAILEGWSENQAKALVDGASLVGSATAADEGQGSTGKASKKEKRPRQRDNILAAAEGAELWHSPEKVAYATINVNGHFEHCKLDSVAFKRWFAGRVYELTSAVPSGQILSDALRVLELKAVADGACHKPLTRTGKLDGIIWLDLCDDEWRAVKITIDGWKIVDTPKVKFVRSEVMAALPEPEGGNFIEELRGFVNAGEDDFKLLVGWLIAALWGGSSEFPVLALGGEQGSGKSTMARLLRGLVDPSAVDALSIPKDDRDFFTMAMTGHVLSFDNVSKIAPWFSDCCCRISTGAGFLTRKLQTDGEPFWFQGSRPLILNGIPSLTDRADLADRALTVRLIRIDETDRRSGDERWAEWELVRPRVLGTLLDAVSASLRRYDDIKLDKMPRMAAFAKLMAAAEPALGWSEGDFMTAYEANRRMTSEASFEADPVAGAICDFIKEQCIPVGEFWEGTATALHDALNKVVTEDQKRSNFWPKKVNALGNAVERAAPLLRNKGIQMHKRSTGSQRLIKFIVG